MAAMPIQETQNSATEITIRAMTSADIPDGLRLREAAGWNQTDADWRRLLELEPDGCFAACEEETVVGTVTVVRYDKDFGWIGMLLIDPGCRKKGLGTRLLHRALDFLHESGITCARLDGTPMGYNLYLRNGFVDEYEVQRWEGISRIETRTGLAPVQASDLESICRFDRRIFGADRSRLLVSLWNRNPLRSAVIREGKEISGYALWRPGARAWYLGPCLADSGEHAQLLIREMLSNTTGEHVFIDVCMKNAWGLKVLDLLEFRYQRPLVRMYRGPCAHFGKPESVYAIAGPELG